MSKVADLVTEVVNYAVGLLKSSRPVVPDMHHALWRYTRDNTTPDLLLEIVGANGEGELGEKQSIGSLAAFYGPEVEVLGVLEMFAADLVVDEAMSVLNDMGYDLPY